MVRLQWWNFYMLKFFIDLLIFEPFDWGPFLGSLTVGTACNKILALVSAKPKSPFFFNFFLSFEPSISAVFHHCPFLGSQISRLIILFHFTRNFPQTHFSSPNLLWPVITFSVCYLSTHILIFLTYCKATICAWPINFAYNKTVFFSLFLTQLKITNHVAIWTSLPHFHQNIILIKENFKPFVPKPLPFIHPYTNFLNTFIGIIFSHLIIPFTSLPPYTRTLKWTTCSRAPSPATATKPRRTTTTTTWSRWRRWRAAWTWRSSLRKLSR